MTDQAVEQEIQASLEPECKGTNCAASAANSYEHSAECLEEAAINQGWADFGSALRALKAGKRVARRGWNGKGMWLSLSGDPAAPRRIPAASFWSPHNAEYAASNADGQATVLPCITMKTATGEILMGWFASQADMLAEDWIVVGD